MMSPSFNNGGPSRIKNYHPQTVTSPVKPTPAIDIQKHLAKEEAADLIDGASLLSANEWVEVAYYQKELDEQKIREEKELRNKQKQQNRLSLERQLFEKKQRSLQEKEAQKQFELMLLQNMKDREQQDLMKKHESAGRAQQ